jgi:hypothetical protein
MSLQQSFGSFATDGEGVVCFLTHDGDSYGVAIADEDIEAQATSEALNNILKPTEARTRTEAMLELVEEFESRINGQITDNFGSEFAWDNHVGETWKFPGDRPYTTSNKEKYLLQMLWDIRHEINDVLHYLDSATEEDLLELFNIESGTQKRTFRPSFSFQNNSGINL